MQRDFEDLPISINGVNIQSGFAGTVEFGWDGSEPHVERLFLEPAAAGQDRVRLEWCGSKSVRASALFLALQASLLRRFEDDLEQAYISKRTTGAAQSYINRHIAA